jgi:alkylglycerol monooxygenase
MLTHSVIVAIYLVTLALFFAPFGVSIGPVPDLPNYIDKAVPVFLLCVALEFLLSLRQRTEHFRVNDSVMSLSLGILQQTFHVATPVKALMIIPYVWVSSYSLVPQLPFAWAMAVGFFAVELGYYWYHRLGHEVNVFWAAHVAHHSSEEYNLTTALRQGALQYSAAFVFFAPIALIGVPVEVFSALHYFNRIYQFFIHTRAVGKLHWTLEYVLNTPSHHRVHHGSNPECIDKNYGGTLIIFDRWFGTFEEENFEVKYGLTHNIDSFNPLWGNLHHWFHIARMFKEHGWIALVVGPGWSPQGPLPIPEADLKAKKYDTMAVRAAPLPMLGLLFVFLQALIAMKVATVAGFGPVGNSLIVAFITATLCVVGAAMEAKAWGRWLDLARIGATAAIIAQTGQIDHRWLALGTAAAIGASQAMTTWGGRKKED